MVWINAKETPPVNEKILVFCKTCKNIHSVFFDKDAYRLVDSCSKGKDKKQDLLWTTEEVEFDLYMDLPDTPTKIKD